MSRPKRPTPKSLDDLDSLFAEAVKHISRPGGWVDQEEQMKKFLELASRRFKKKCTRP